MPATDFHTRREDVLRGLQVGDTVTLDNRALIAYCFYGLHAPLDENCD